MNKSLITGPIVGVMLVLVSGQIVGAKLSANKVDHADVIQVMPVMRLLRTPRQTCRDEEVLYVQPQQQSDSRWLTGTVLGAIVGGLVGNQIGDGEGRRIATGVGAIAGAYAGNRIQASEKTDNVFVNTDRRCFTTIDLKEELIGYDVRYRIGRRPAALVRTNYDPGKRIPIRAGKLLLDGKTRNQ